MPHTHELKIPAGLHSFFERIHTGYYSTISHACKNSSNLIAEMSTKYLSADCTAYIAICEKIIAATAGYIEERMQVFIPYVNNQKEKENTGHDCAICTGNCKLLRSEKIAGFDLQMKAYKDTISCLLKASAKLYKREGHNNMPALHDKMVMLHNMVTELLYMEENTLTQKAH